MDQPTDIVVQIGVPETVRLTGISDGNIAAAQPLTITAGDMQVAHEAGSPYATLSFTPKRPAPGRHRDGRRQERRQSATRRPFQVRAVAEWNHPPTIDQHEDMTLFLEAPEQRVGLGASRTATAAGSPSKLSESSDPSVLAASVDMAAARGQPAPGAERPQDGHLDCDGDRGRPGRRCRQQRGPERADDLPRHHARAPAGRLERHSPTGRRRAALESRGRQHAVSQEMEEARASSRWTARTRSRSAASGLPVPDMDLSEYPYLTVDVQPARTT